MRHDSQKTSVDLKPNSVTTDSVWAEPSTLLQVSEIYASIQGESSYAGRPCTFVRLSGCPLRCRWCDTVYSYKGGEELSLNVVMERIADAGLKLVELTGGEPLAQASAIPLMNQLVEENFLVLLETSGSESLEQVPASVHIIMDIKCPDSLMAERNRWDNLQYLKPTDELKFVIASRADFDWAVEKVQTLKLDLRAVILFSPAFGLVKPDVLSAWILESKVNCRLNLQIHKYIWDPKAKGV